MANEISDSFSLNTTDLDKLSKLLYDLDLILNNIADFGILGLAYDYVQQLESLGKKLSDFGIESVQKAVTEFIKGFNTANHDLMAKNLFYLYNWYQLYSRKLHILNLKMELKDESILNKAKESVGLLAENDVTFVPLSIIIKKTTEKNNSFYLNLNWVGVLLKEGTLEVLTLAIFEDECITTYHYDSLYLFYDRLKSKFFINQLILYNQLMNSPILFTNIGTKIITGNSTDEQFIELEYTVNSKTNFSSNYSIDQVKGLITNVPGFRIINYNRNCTITIDETNLVVKFSLDGQDYNIQCGNIYLVRQLFLLNFTGISVNVMLVNCSRFHQFTTIDHSYLDDKNEYKNHYHVVTVNQGGENIVVALQQFNIKLNYTFIFDKIVLKFTAPLDNFESYVKYLFYFKNSQLPKKNPKIQSNLLIIEKFVDEIIENNDKLTKICKDNTKIVIFIFLAKEISILEKKEKFEILLNYIVSLKRSKLNIETFKDYLIALAILVKVGTTYNFIDSEKQTNIIAFSKYFKMKPSSIESLVVKFISNQNIPPLYDPIEKYMKKLTAVEKFVENFLEIKKLDSIILKELFNKQLNISQFERRMLELKISWDIVQKKDSILDPIVFYFFKQ